MRQAQLFWINSQHRDHRSSPPLGVAAGHLRSLRDRGMDAEIASVESGMSV